jgi:hypothetical protein
MEKAVSFVSAKTWKEEIAQELRPAAAVSFPAPRTNIPGGQWIPTSD